MCNSYVVISVEIDWPSLSSLTSIILFRNCKPKPKNWKLIQAALPITLNIRIAWRNVIQTFFIIICVFETFTHF